MKDKLKGIKTNKKVLPHWEIMKTFDEVMYQKVADWRQCISFNEIIPTKNKELMMVAMCCVIKYSAGIEVHAKYALESGATQEELFATAAQSMLVGGIPAYREGVMAMKKLFEIKV